MEKENIYVKLARIEEILKQISNDLEEKKLSIKELYDKIQAIEFAEPNYRRLMTDIYTFMTKQAKLLEEKNKIIEEEKTEKYRFFKEWKRYIVFTITGGVIAFFLSSKILNSIFKYILMLINSL